MTLPRRPRALWLAAGAAILAAAAGCTSAPEGPAATASSGPSPSSSCAGYAVDASTGGVVCKGADGADVVNQGPKYGAPKPADFTITVKILKKECFGSAGCNVTYRIDPQYSGAELDPATTWLVTYEVHGVEDGPHINTFELTGDDASIESEEIAQTPSSRTKLTAKATEVLPG